MIRFARTPELEPRTSTLEPRTPALERPTVLDLIGHTPLARLEALESAGSRIYAKLEWQNPGGSVKDRAAARMIADGERRGALLPGGTILDATSGNTGIAYAMLGAALGYGVRLCVPGNVTPERLRVLRVFGAQVELTDPMDGSDGAIRQARAIHAREPRLFYPDQYNNDANWRAHYDTTGVEIWDQTAGAITHFVAGLGTSGTFMGTTRRLRAIKPDVRAISVQPDGPLHGIEGLKHMASSIVPGIYDEREADLDLRVSTEEAHAMTRRLASELGLLAGVSSGAAAVAAARVAASAPGSVVVTIFPDGGGRYLSEPFWEEQS